MSLTQEQIVEGWKPAAGCDTGYWVSKNGKVAKGDVAPQEVLKQYLHNGYSYVRARLDGKSYGARVHVLVAKTFIPNPENKYSVNHINGIKDDNRVENLEWATLAENNQHAWRTGLCKPRKGSDAPRAQINEQQALDIVVRLAKGETCRSIAALYGVKENIITAIKCGRSWTHVTNIKHESRKDKVARVVNSYKRKCAECNTEFIPDRYAARRGIGIFCSRFCAGQRNGRLRKGIKTGPKNKNKSK